jgi:exosome complex component RRP42
MDKINVDQDYVMRLASKGQRKDGRKPDEFREVHVETGVIENAEGSAKVRMGGTEVLVGVKLGIGQPFDDRPEEGILMTNAELSPLSSPFFESGPPREDAVELARVIDRGIRESHTIETDKLCITPKEKVWMVFIDISIMNHDGNLIDAAGLAAAAALSTAKMPDYADEKINHDKRTKKLPVKFKPVPVTAYKVNGQIFLDPDLGEEFASTNRLTVTTKDDGNVCAMQKGGTESLSPEEINKVLELSTKRGKELRKLLE